MNNFWCCFSSVSGALETIRLRIPVICRGLPESYAGTLLPPPPPPPTLGPFPDISVVLVWCAPSFVFAKKEAFSPFFKILIQLPETWASTQVTLWQMFNKFIQHVHFLVGWSNILEDKLWDFFPNTDYHVQCYLCLLLLFQGPTLTQMPCTRCKVFIYWKPALPGWRNGELPYDLKLCVPGQCYITDHQKKGIFQAQKGPYLKIT